MTFSRKFLSVMLFSSLLVGCGGSHSGPSASSDYAPSSANMMTSTAAGFVDTMEMAVAAPASPQSTNAIPEVSPERFARKIIYTTNISLNVESFNDIATKVVQLTDEHQGFIAAANLSGSSGNQRSGSWTIRLPVDQYRAFLDSAGRIGEIRSKREQTREVTSEFYDIEARIRNKQTEEKRLITLLEERPGKLDDVLTFEKEISRVRGEIEQMQGRLRVLADLTAFSTVTLQITEVQTYIPPKAPSFATLVARQWQSTVEELTAAGQWLVLTAISVGPWVLILSLMALLAYVILRCVIRMRIRQPAV